MSQPKFLSIFLSILFSASVAAAQENSAAPVQPFLFSAGTLTAETPSWNLGYTGSYGERTSGAFGYDGLDQRFTLKGYLGHRLTLFGNMAVGVSNSGQVSSAQTAEVIRDVIGGKKAMGPRAGIGLGVSRDWTNVASFFSRLTASYDTRAWRLGGNLKLEKAFDSARDQLDVITSIGVQHRVTGTFFLGVEAIGQDLEGFWEEDEAEGGAKLLIGPSLNILPQNSRFSFTACGGPLFYATRSSVIPSQAVRDLPAHNGYSIRAMVNFNLHR